MVDVAELSELTSVVLKYDCDDVICEVEVEEVLSVDEAKKFVLEEIPALEICSIAEEEVLAEEVLVEELAPELA